MVATTGMRPWASSWWTMTGSTWTTSPTYPSASERAVAVIRLASSPDSPTARAPWTLMVLTMSRLTFPTSTMRTRSMVSASVTRNPSWNSTSLPTRAMSAPIWGPPPWTTTGSMPTDRISTMSSANEANASASSTAGSPGLAPRTLPPYLTTTTLPQNRRM